MSKFNEFFEKLGSDAKLMEQYKQDPEGVMQAHGLTAEEIQAVMSGDQDKIKKLSGKAQNFMVYIHVQSPSR